MKGKICGKCKEFKPHIYFHKLKSNPDGLYNWCKECKKLYDKEYRQTEKIQSLYSSPEYKKRKREYRRDNIERSLYNTTKSRARYRGIEHNISVEDIVIPEVCPILGIKIKNEIYSNNWDAPSIDRKDNSKGYVKDNIWVISRLANTMKFTADKNTLETFCKKILIYIQNGTIK